MIELGKRADQGMAAQIGGAGDWAAGGNDNVEMVAVGAALVAKDGNGLVSIVIDQEWRFSGVESDQRDVAVLDLGKLVGRVVKLLIDHFAAGDRGEVLLELVPGKRGIRRPRRR